MDYKPYGNHCFCTSGVNRKMCFPSDPHSSVKEITAGTMKTLGETTHSLCCNARPTGPLKS